MEKPRVYCDFNNGIEDGLYALGDKNLANDMRRMGISLNARKRDLKVTFYMEDADGQGMECLLRRLRSSHPDLRITAEARTREEALDAIAGDCDVVLLDNMTPTEMRNLIPVLRAAASKRPRPLELEASGGVDLTTVAEIAETGVDRVSVGALTHSANALDLSLALEMKA